MNEYEFVGKSLEERKKTKWKTWTIFQIGDSTAKPDPGLLSSNGFLNSGNCTNGGADSAPNKHDIAGY